MLNLSYVETLFEFERIDNLEFICEKMRENPV